MRGANIEVACEATQSGGSSEILPPFVLVDRQSTFEDMLVALRDERVLAFDTESDSLYRYRYRVCLVQISAPSCDFLVDTLSVPDLSPLGELLADPSVEKVFHAAENDVLSLKKDFQFRFARVFDTMIAARILGFPRVGLAALLAEEFNVVLDKRSQLTDWGRRPLTDSQLSYARLDSRYLIPLRDRLEVLLRERRRWEEAQETFAELPSIEYFEKPFDPEGFWRIPGARELQPGELAVLRELYLWREQQAQESNRPLFKVLADRQLISMSRLRPTRMEDLSLSSWQIERFGRALIRAIARGQAARPPMPKARLRMGNGRPDPHVQAGFDRLRAWRAERAMQRGVAADVVLTNEVLLSVAKANPSNLSQLATLGILGPWRLQEYGEDLIRVLSA